MDALKAYGIDPFLITLAMPGWRWFAAELEPESLAEQAAYEWNIYSSEGEHLLSSLELLQEFQSLLSLMPPLGKVIFTKVMPFPEMESGTYWLDLAVTVDGVTKTDATEVVIVSKYALRQAVSETARLKQSRFTPASWQGFAAALKDAQAILGKADATAEEVDAATAALNNAMDGLVKRYTGLLGFLIDFFDRILYFLFGI